MRRTKRLSVQLGYLGSWRASVFVGLALAAAFPLVNCSGSTNPTSDGSPPGFVANAAATNLDKPLDAVPSPLGDMVYFIAGTASGRGVFSVPVPNGKVLTLLSGAPLVAPRGIATSSDGKLLYVADPSADAIFQLPANGGAPAVVAGTAGTKPRALDVRDEPNGDQIFFAGTNAKGEPAIFQLPASGGTPKVLGAGKPFVTPDGVAVTSDGFVMVSDRDAKKGTDLPGEFIVIHPTGEIHEQPTRYLPGEPAGIGLNSSESNLLFSTLNKDTGASEVILYHDKNQPNYVQTIPNSKVSGGVHCSHKREVCAWAGYTTVYSLKLAPSPGSTPGGVCD
jgi:hypothetical protein